MQYRKTIIPYITDTPFLLNSFSSQQKKLLFEGVQGTFMDVDFGDYPFVGPASYTSGGACTGSGIAPTGIKHIIGVTKSYSTRVGDGPFPTELLDDTGEELRAAGGEYGSTTGRPRRCGWLDLLMLRYSSIVNGFTGLCVTKLDVLDSFEKIKVCIGYKYKGEVCKDMSPNPSVLKDCEPVYKEFPGWKKSTIDIRKYEQLPVEARNYLEFIEQETGVMIYLISVGQQKEHTIIKKEVW